MTALLSHDMVAAAGLRRAGDGVCCMLIAFGEGWYSDTFRGAGACRECLLVMFQWRPEDGVHVGDLESHGNDCS